MPRKLDPKIIRVGDTVKIVNPQFFVRCGYPLSFEDACDIVRREYKEKIASFLDSFGFTRTPIWFDPIYKEPNNTLYSQGFDKIVKALAFDYVKAKGFGGRERKIYTKESPDYKGKRMEVEGVRMVQTGVYSPGDRGRTYGYGYYNEYDYDPPYLVDQKTHKILSLDPLDAVFFRVGNNIDDYSIVATNVEKVFEDA